MLCNVTLWLQLKIFEMGWDELLWFKVGEACNVKVIWTHAGETFLCDIFDIWQQRGSCKANRSSFSQILPVDSCIFDDQLDTRDCQGRSGPFVTIRQMGPSLALQICAMFSCYPILQLDEPLCILRAYSIWYNWCMCLNIEQSQNIPFLQSKVLHGPRCRWLTEHLSQCLLPSFWRWWVSRKSDFLFFCCRFCYVPDNQNS